MKLSHRLGGQSEGRLLWSRWRRLAAPSLFFLGVIYYEELFLKLYCFHGLSLAGAVFPLLFSIPIAMLLGALCGGVEDRLGRRLLVLCTALVSLWMGAQTVYYHLFKTFLTIFSLTKMMMVAGAFGNMAVGEILLNWFPILMMAVPVVLAAMLGNRLLPDRPMGRRNNLRWLALGLGVQLAGTRRWIQAEQSPAGEEPKLHTMDIDFQALMERDREDLELSEMHGYFSKVKPTAENEWTGRFQGKNLVWIVAEGFSDRLLDPVRTPTLWKLAHEGIICDNFYTPLWGVSTSDGEYVTTTGLIPKSGVWSYSESSDNAMPFAFGHQFRALGYRTMAFHDYLYTYYDRNLSHPNMGYEYYGIGNGLELEEVFPPSDLEMMEEIVPRFVDEDHFMVYCLTVSGHLNYNREGNVMSDRHYDEVAGLPYSEGVKCYLACQQELELAMESLVRQLEEAGRLEDTVIVLSADHYPYGLTDEEYSELFGHPVDPVFEIYENSLILWSADLEEPVHVDKYCSSLDVMPTLANLFGLEYDSRLMAGRDILSDTPGLVIFSNYSFLTDLGAYNSTTDVFTMWDGSEPDPDYVAERVAEVQNRVAYSASILDNDYYRVVFGDPED